MYTNSVVEDLEGLDSLRRFCHYLLLKDELKFFFTHSKIGPSANHKKLLAFQYIFTTTRGDESRAR